MYVIQSLWTAAKLKVPVIIIIVNNRSYGALVHFGGIIGVPEPVGTLLEDLDFVALAKGHNVPAERVEKAGDLDAALGRALAAKGPYLIDVAVVGR